MSKAITYPAVRISGAGSPHAQRIAHNQAQLAIPQQLKAIWLVFAEDDSCVLAEHVLETLRTHANDYDQPLEIYLLAPA